jgi:hypothetical protein
VAGMNWLDALVEASMILSGMGPISPLLTTSAKVFASLYALFSGLIFVLAMGIVLSPLVHSLLNQFQVNLKKENYEQGERQQKDKVVYTDFKKEKLSPKEIGNKSQKEAA